MKNLDREEFQLVYDALKNFASMNQSFKDWLTTCPEEYIWQIIEVTEDLEGTFTFRRIAK